MSASSSKGSLNVEFWQCALLQDFLNHLDRQAYAKVRVKGVDFNMAVDGGAKAAGAKAETEAARSALTARDNFILIGVAE